jgi:signal peptidase I
MADENDPDPLTPEPDPPLHAAPDDGKPVPVSLEKTRPAPGSGRHAAPLTPVEPVETGDGDLEPEPGVPPEGETFWQRRKRKKAEKARKPRRKAPWWELPALVALAILIAILVKTFVIQPFYIPSDSMEHTLHGCPGCSGDRILVNKPIFDFRDPEPGDIVVFHAPPGWDNEPTTHPPGNAVVRWVRGFGQLVGFVPPDGEVLVKRVIATGGQTVKGVDGVVEVSDNGVSGPFRKLHEPYVYISDAGSNEHTTFGPVTVPSGRLWVMGDHRNDSEDSRFHCGPDATDASGGPCDPTTSTVPVDDVIGKAFVIAWPPSRWRTLGTPATFENAAGALPSAASLLMVGPLWLLRRRRRRR